MASDSTPDKKYEYRGRCKYCGDTFVRWGVKEVWPRDVCTKCYREGKGKQ